MRKNKSWVLLSKGPHITWKPFVGKKWLLQRCSDRSGNWGGRIRAREWWCEVVALPLFSWVVWLLFAVCGVCTQPLRKIPGWNLPSGGGCKTGAFNSMVLVLVRFLFRLCCVDPALLAQDVYSMVCVSPDAASSSDWNTQSDTTSPRLFRFSSVVLNHS